MRGVSSAMRLLSLIADETLFYNPYHAVIASV